jgi:hypothetical protein
MSDGVDELVPVTELRAGDYIRLSETMTATLLDITVLRNPQAPLVRLEFSQAHGQSLRVSLPSTAMLPRLRSHVFRVVGRLIRCEGYERVVTAPSAEDARAIAQIQVTREFPDLREFAINRVEAAELPS